MTSKHSQAPVLISQGVFDSVKTFRDFEQRVFALFDTNTKAQGDAFEIFVEAYLATHVNFSNTYKTDKGFKLGRWVEVQKANEDSLSPEKKQLLESLSGWKWAKPKTDWMEVFNLMKDFEKSNGHVNFSNTYKTDKGFKQGRWVEVQKANEDSLSPEKKQLLESLSGWKWAKKREKS